MLESFKNRLFRLLAACMSLLLLINMIEDTYAKYVSSAEAESTFTIARWAFTVNNQDVISNSDFSNTLVPVIDTNANIASGVIAPTSTGYFDITIDASNVGVSFDETITVTSGDDNTVTDLVFTGYTKNNGTLIPITNSNTLTTTHLLSQNPTTTTYRFFIEWVDGNGETMDNEDDTQASIDGVASVNISIQFIQRAS